MTTARKRKRRPPAATRVTRAKSRSRASDSCLAMGRFPPLLGRENCCLGCLYSDTILKRNSLRTHFFFQCFYIPLILVTASVEHNGFNLFLSGFLSQTLADFLCDFPLFLFRVKLPI